ncbi:UNVERIFIED_CONTAM: hypothetical protein K2H54_060872 [Gekko kuhli]
MRRLLDSASPSSEEDDAPTPLADSSLSETEDNRTPVEVIPSVPVVDTGGAMVQLTMPLIDKLTDSNYSSWSLKMEWFLKREALWKFVHNPPASPMSAADAASDEKALAHIILSLSDSQLVFVRSQQSAKGAERAQGYPIGIGEEIPGRGSNSSFFG